ncbi:MAG: hypothetical protein ABFD81_01725 [Syntrophaceae bacterium]
MAEAQTRSIGVCHPDSRLIQSCLVTNLALELAKRQHPVMVQDFLPPGEASIRTLMGTIVTQDEQAPDQALIRLYGLPEILIAQARPGQVWKVPGRAPETIIREGSRKWDQLINLENNLDFLCSSDAASDYILITQTGDNPMLKAYAYLKAMHARHDRSRLYLVMDDAPTLKDAEHLFNRFNGFVKKHLGISIVFLGNLIQDETLQRSIVERRPLVLARERGETAMVSICTRFLDTLESDDTLRMEVD